MQQQYLKQREDTKINPNPFITMFGNLKIDVNYNTSISYSFREISILSDSNL